MCIRDRNMGGPANPNSQGRPQPSIPFSRNMENAHQPNFMNYMNDGSAASNMNKSPKNSALMKGSGVTGGGAGGSGPSPNGFSNMRDMQINKAPGPMPATSGNSSFLNQSANAGGANGIQVKRRDINLAAGPSQGIKMDQDAMMGAGTNQGYMVSQPTGSKGLTSSNFVPGSKPGATSTNMSSNTSMTGSAQGNFSANNAAYKGPGGYSAMPGPAGGNTGNQGNYGYLGAGPGAGSGMGGGGAGSQPYSRQLLGNMNGGSQKNMGPGRGNVNQVQNDRLYERKW
eukprot:TRINITY_DN2551_c0_g1_i1.p2 TRINITY_DN2551_c0_g1~~TRINITY_DN2551_c0_g1_i1.p2  ORF type:complete len:284 (-),score=45.57 TRINITY_DN2551_c0_g1_i1:107-958(-)